jgi:diguanylate cyclase with GGDEF domain
MLPAMAHRWSNPEADDSFLQFRERSIRDGAWLSLVVTLIVFAYVLIAWRSGDGVLIAVLLFTALASTNAVSRLPAAAIVRSRWREHFFLAHLGGDEFAVLLPETGPDELRAVAERLGRQLALVSAASLGLASLPADGETAEELHRRADADLYRVKQRRAAAVA